MSSRRLACLLLGLWLGAGLFMALVSWQNVRTAARLLDPPHPAVLLETKPLAAATLRSLFRYEAAEQTRFYYETWETAQLVLAALFFFFLLFGTREDKYSLAAALVLLGAAAFQRFWFTPQISALGRMADFLPEQSVERVKLMVLETGYRWTEAGKAAIGLALAARLMRGRRSGSPSDIRQELDLINKANYGHIDR
jgi:hypothetical protein